ncbi:reverse transcriptase domain-containing protein [Tanacetum coccineum]
MAHDSMNQVVREEATVGKNVSNKRKWGSDHSRDYDQQQSKRIEMVRAHATGAENMPTSGQGLSAATIEQLITQRVVEAMTAYEANQNNRNGNGIPNLNVGGVVPIAYECTYLDFVKCQPLNFKGTEGVVGLTRWFEKMETVFHIINCPKKYQVKLQDAIRIANHLMDQKLNGYIARNTENKSSAGILPLYDMCKLHHHGPCPVRCGNCKKVSHQARDCWASTTMACYGCGGKGHTKRGLDHYARNYTVRPRRKDDAYLQTQLLIAQKLDVGIQLQAKEFNLMVVAGDIDKIEDVNANCVLMDGTFEVPDSYNCYDNEIFNMFTQEEQYTELLEPILEPHQVQQNDSNVIPDASSVEQSGGTVDQNPTTAEEMRAHFE